MLWIVPADDSGKLHAAVGDGINGNQFSRRAAQSVRKFFQRHAVECPAAQLDIGKMLQANTGFSRQLLLSETAKPPPLRKIRVHSGLPAAGLAQRRNVILQACDLEGGDHWRTVKWGKSKNNNVCRHDFLDQRNGRSAK